MGNRLAYLPLFVRDFLTDPNVLQMRWLDQAIYLRMLMASWEAGPLPDDATMIGRMVDEARLHGELEAFGASFDVRDAIVGVLESCWRRTDAGWICPRLEAERERSLALVRRQSEGGLEGNRRRWTASATDRQAIGDRSVSDRQAIGERSDSDEKTSVTDRTPIGSQAQAQAQEEKNKKKNPPNPPGGEASSGKAPPRVQKIRPAEWAGLAPPSPLGAAWEEWLTYRREEKRKPVTQRSGDLALRELQAMGATRAVAAIHHTIARGWQGIREPEPPRTNGHGAPDATRADRQYRDTLKELGL